MSLNNGSRVLAIGIDAAEPTLIQSLVEQNKLPTLKSLLGEGKWFQVKSPAHIGSGSVWPSFITGEEASKHGVYGEWSWQPRTMNLRRYSGRQLKAFWKPLTEEGIRVGIMDVPFSPFVGVAEGFEVLEWGPHDLLEGSVQTAPAAVTNLVSQNTHPLTVDRLDTGGPRDADGLKKLAAGCLEGVRLRGSLAQRLLTQKDPHLSIIVFTEIHHSAHYLWHTQAPDHALYRQSLFENLPPLKSGLIDIYCEVDRQIGRLVENVVPETTVFVFSLHGMRPTHGVPTFLQPLLCERGYAKMAGWTTKSWTERAVGLMASVKRHTPTALKKLYYKTMSPSTTMRLARPTMLAAYDWQQTKVFPLPADQHGWVHINLKGREGKGIVHPQEYEGLCQELEQMLRALKASDGRPIVHKIFRTAQNVEQAMAQTLPDLVVHWEDAAFSSPLRIEGTDFESEPTGKKFTGRHALDGFCIIKGASQFPENGTIDATDMHKLISDELYSQRRGAEYQAKSANG